MEYWSIGVIVWSWSIGVLEQWSDGVIQSLRTFQNVYRVICCMLLLGF